MRSLAILLALLPILSAGEADALRLDAELRARHMPYSTVIDPVFQSPDTMEIAGYTRCGDSAIWTGHYLAAESFRWAVTHSPEARANIMESLNGIRKLVDVTGADLLARCAVPVDSPWAAGIASEEAPNQIRAGAVDGRNYLWAGRTSRDQYSGVFFGLTAAWNLVPDRKVPGLAPLPVGAVPCPEKPLREDPVGAKPPKAGPRLHVVFPSPPPR